MNRTTKSRLSKITHVRKLYGQVLERNGKVSKTKLSRLNAKASELYTFTDDPLLGKLASLIAGIAIGAVHWAESKDDRELEFIFQKIKAAGVECERITEEGERNNGD
ncbi:hypothetical protein [Rummeliibacillus suwonensis]|uniref:hypothetical protein n=1 Tax=Rummeliibacillus suwonensis TaxID=1306154 RepID=UPI0011B6582F|nr:hypothetical protein [Rummeliibacillus suwonensis]